MFNLKGNSIMGFFNNLWYSVLKVSSYMNSNLHTDRLEFMFLQNNMTNSSFF